MQRRKDIFLAVATNERGVLLPMSDVGVVAVVPVFLVVPAQIFVSWRAPVITRNKFGRFRSAPNYTC